MSSTILLKALTLWLAILVLAILNGTLREKVLIPLLGAFIGLAASGLVLSSCIFLVAFVAVPWYGYLAAYQWLLVGLLWLVLTLVFEFSFVRLVQHKAWLALLESYTFKGGNLWPLVLVVTLISPWLAADLRGFV